MFEGDDALLNKTAGSPAFMAPESLQSRDIISIVCLNVFKIFKLILKKKNFNQKKKISSAWNFSPKNLVYAIGLYS